MTIATPGAAPALAPPEAIDPEAIDPEAIDKGHLSQNIMLFGRVLRAAGLPVGPGSVLEAVRAVSAVGCRRREDFYWALHAVLVNRRDQREIFDQAFHVFWRNPNILGRMMSLIVPTMTTGPEVKEELAPRLAEALNPGMAGNGPSQPREETIEFDAVLTWSDREVRRSMDFDKMSAAELAAAKAQIARMRLPVAEIKTRRFRRDPRGRRIDMRETMRGALRHGGDPISLRRRKARTRPPPLVILCDISGSMSRYARMFVHFMHAVSNDRDRVHTFVFGTRLTNVTRQLRNRDIDVALERVAGAATDWSGGTRMGACLRDFNRHWSRRVPTQGAVVLLVSDGLDRDAAAGLSREIARLHRSSRRLIWLNPLLRYDAYAPKSMGARAILPHVDEFRPVHNLESLGDLCAALTAPEPGPAARRDIAEWRARAAA